MSKPGRSPLIAGIAISIGGESYTLPPLGLGGLKSTTQLRKNYDGAAEEEQLDATIAIIHAALVRNYPDFTLQEMTDKIHAWEVMELMAALPILFDRSGMEKAASAGEAN